MKKRYIVLILIIGFGVAFWFLLKEASAPTLNNTAQYTLSPETLPAQKDDLIIVEKPLPQSVVSSPMSIKGKARGNWYFEASFPIVVTDIQNNVIGQGIATAQGDWMTTAYVPFTASISYTLPPNTTNVPGFLILKKDNPSGEPQFDNQLSIPVILQ